MGCGGRCRDLRGYSLEKIRSMRGGKRESYNIPPNTPLSYVSVAPSRAMATASASNPKMPLHVASLQHAFPSFICDSLANSEIPPAASSSTAAVDESSWRTWSGASSEATRSRRNWTRYRLVYSPIMKLTQILPAMHFSVRPVNQDAWLNPS
jgi:hypothetical protein